MWQRIVVQKTPAPWIGALAAAAATAVSVHTTDAFAPSPLQLASCEGSGRPPYTTFLDTHRTKCDSDAPKTWRRERLRRWFSSAPWPLSSLKTPSDDGLPLLPPDVPAPWRKLVGEDSNFESVDWHDRYSDPQHAINGALAPKPTLIERYKLYRPATNHDGFAPTTTNTTDDGDRLVMVARVDFGTHLNGHGGVVHGGILGLVFDDAIGCGSYEALMYSSVPNKADRTLVTANLSIDYRRPVPQGTKVLIEVTLDRWEGRKFFLKARMINAERRQEHGDEILYAEATSLYILLREDPE